MGEGRGATPPGFADGSRCCVSVSPVRVLPTAPLLVKRRRTNRDHTALREFAAGSGVGFVAMSPRAAAELSEKFRLAHARTPVPNEFAVSHEKVVRK